MSAIWRGHAAGPFFALAFAALCVACLYWTRDHAVPIALGVLVWFLVNALSDALCSLPGPRLPRLLRRIIAVALLFVALAITGRIVSANVAELSAAIEARDHTALARLRSFAAHVGLEDLFTYTAIAERFSVDKLAGPILSVAQTLASDVSLVFLYALFLMIDERYYAAKLRALQPDPQKRAALRASLRAIAEQTRLYLWLMTLVSLGVAMATWAVCTAFGVAGAGFWGFLAFGLNFIPTIGSIAAVLAPAGYALLTLADPTAVLAVAAILGMIQFLAGEVVVPRVMGDGLNLSSTVIMLALVSWGAVWGPAGMFLAIPLTVILGMVLARFPSTRPLAVILSRDGSAGIGDFEDAPDAAVPDALETDEMRARHEAERRETARREAAGPAAE